MLIGGTMNEKNKPLFMWAGGKSKMIKHHEKYFPEKFEKYHEPFFGGGAVFTYIKERHPEVKCYINDINPHIIDIYLSIRDDVDSFCKEVDKLQKEYISLPSPSEKGGETNKVLQKKYSLGKARYEWDKIFKEQPSRRHMFFKVRDQYAWNHQGWSKTYESAVLYFLMKTAFNGIWQINKNTNDRFGTPCGLLKQEKLVYDKGLVRRWSEMLQGCVITSKDFKDTIDDVDENSFVYLDPPYRGCFADYGTRDDDEFQEGVIDFHHKAGEQSAHSILCNRDIGDDFFEKRKKDSSIYGFDVTYTAGRRKKVETEDGDTEYEAKKAREVILVTPDREKK
jgi:DNA adenine methylase